MRTLHGYLDHKKRDMGPRLIARGLATPVALEFGIWRQLLYRNVQRFRGGLVSEAHRRLYRSTLGLRVMETKKKFGIWGLRDAIGVRACKQEVLQHLCRGNSLIKKQPPPRTIIGP